MPRRARGEKSAFNEAIKKKKKKQHGAGGEVLFYLYKDMIHVCTSSHRQGTAGIVTPVGQGLSVAPAPSRRPCRSEREAEARGTVVRLFPKEKQTKPPPKTDMLSQKNKTTKLSSPNFSILISGEGVSYPGRWRKPWEG